MRWADLERRRHRRRIVVPADRQRERLRDRSPVSTANRGGEQLQYHTARAEPDDTDPGDICLEVNRRRSYTVARQRAPDRVRDHEYGDGIHACKRRRFTPALLLITQFKSTDQAGLMAEVKVVSTRFASHPILVVDNGFCGGPAHAPVPITSVLGKWTGIADHDWAAAVARRRDHERHGFGRHRRPRVSERRLP